MNPLKGSAHPKWTGGRKLTTNGYIRVRRPEHPHADKDGHIMEHILIVEQALGHYPPERSEIHHVNELRSDNSRGNLVLCEDHGYHSLLHIRTAALDACGHAGWRKCAYCGSYDDPAFMRVHDRQKRNLKYCHAECRNRRQREGRAA
jgi:hypothetical protein